MWPNLEGALEAAGHRLRRRKCKFWAPARSDAAEDFPEIQALRAIIKESVGGLHLLGTAAQGDLETLLGPLGLAAEPVRERQQAAEKFCRALSRYATSRVDDAAQKAAWQLLTKIAARALDFDVQVCDYEVIRPILEQHVATVRTTAEEILGKPFDDTAWEQTTLPGRLGGLGMAVPSPTAAAAAFWSAAKATREEALRFADANGRPLRSDAEIEMVEKAEQVLLAAGVVATTSKMTLTPFATNAILCSPWKQDTMPQEAFAFDDECAADVNRELNKVPPSDHTHGLTPKDRRSRRRLAGRINRALDLLRACRVWRAEPSARRRRTMLEGGGPGVGRTWTTPPGRQVVKMTGAQWQTSTLLRLGLLTRPPRCLTCCLRKADHKPCNKALDDELLHVTSCNCGPVRHRPHECAKHALSSALRGAGANTDIERYIPELYTPDHEAILDLSVSWPGSAETYLLDVTVRSPDAVGRQRADGTCNTGARALYDKHSRYGATVLAIVVGHRGRSTPQTRDAFAKLGAESRRWAQARLGSKPGIRPATLQLVVEAAAIRAVADAHLLALGATSAAALGWTTSRRAAPPAPVAPAAPARAEEVSAPADGGDPARLAARSPAAESVPSSREDLEQFGEDLVQSGGVSFGMDTQEDPDPDLRFGL